MNTITVTDSDGNLYTTSLDAQPDSTVEYLAVNKGYKIRVIVEKIQPPKKKYTVKFAQPTVDGKDYYIVEAFSPKPPLEGWASYSFHPEPVRAIVERFYTAQEAFKWVEHHGEFSTETGLFPLGQGDSGR